ncbi:hypothetical protein CDL15_Pgr016735 [Punica granatum]|uniref:Uncharacterized protein n=1 Tax=Punica granatum TaxID=22663 RepID=A0A218WXN6_PUNGR|nr:hypothetical protein CDL15_Pgr016735 [Punica granatum]
MRVGRSRASECASTGAASGQLGVERAWASGCSKSGHGDVHACMRLSRTHGRTLERLRAQARTIECADVRSGNVRARACARERP